jgi:hypothetical protein
MAKGRTRKEELDRAERKYGRRMLFGHGIWAAGGCASVIAVIAVPIVWILA